MKPVVFGIILLFHCNAPANAELVKFRMTGTVTVNDPTSVLPAGVVTGAPFTALLEYDRGLPDSLPDDARRGRYNFSGADNKFGLVLTIGDLVLRDDPADDIVIQVIDDSQLLPGFGPLSDTLIVQVNSLGGPSVPTNLLQPKISVVWDSVDLGLWDSDGLPSYLDLPKIQRAEILADGPDEQPPLGRPYSITASVSEVWNVPEPNTLSITAFAAFLVLAYRARHVKFAMHSPPQDPVPLATLAHYVTGGRYDAFQEKNNSPVSQSCNLAI